MLQAVRELKAENDTLREKVEQLEKSQAAKAQRNAKKELLRLLCELCGWAPWSEISFFLRQILHSLPSLVSPLPELELIRSSAYISRRSQSEIPNEKAERFLVDEVADH